MPDKAFEQYGFAGGIAVLLLFAGGFITKWLLAKLDQKDVVIQGLYQQTVEMNKQMMQVISANTASNVSLAISNDNLVQSNDNLVAELKSTLTTNELLKQIQTLARVQSDLMNKGLT